MAPLRSAVRHCRIMRKHLPTSSSRLWADRRLTVPMVCVPLNRVRIATGIHDVRGVYLIAMQELVELVGGTAKIIILGQIDAAVSSVQIDARPAHPIVVRSQVDRH